MLSHTTIKVIAVTEVTTVGCPDGPYPMDHGNCFSVATEDGRYFKIVNFSFENLEELIRRGVGFPFEIAILEGWLAYIHDPRIPDNWYLNKWCEICCPSASLPLNQQLAHDRQRKQGVREESSRSVCYRWHLAPKV